MSRGDGSAGKGTCCQIHELEFNKNRFLFGFVFQDRHGGSIHLLTLCLADGTGGPGAARVSATEGV